MSRARSQEKPKDARKPGSTMPGKQTRNDQAGKILLYDQDNYKGNKMEFTVGDCPDGVDLASYGFKSRTRSLKVIGSVWVASNSSDSSDVHTYVLEDSVEYPTPNDIWHALHPGIIDLPWDAGLFGFIQPLALDFSQRDPEIVLYSERNFKGKKVTLRTGASNIADAIPGWNPIPGLDSSIAWSWEVTQGTWLLYQDPGYNKQTYIHTKGETVSLPDPVYSINTFGSIRPVKMPEYLTEVISIQYQVESAMKDIAPKTLVHLSQTNDTDHEEEAEWDQNQTKSTTVKASWSWQYGSSIGTSMTTTVGCPKLGFGEDISISSEQSYNVGQEGGSENTTSESWTFKIKSTVYPHTKLEVFAVIKEGIIDVPYVAELDSCGYRYTETGVFHGVNSFDIDIQYKQTDLGTGDTREWITASGGSMKLNKRVGRYGRRT